MSQDALIIGWDDDALRGTPAGAAGAARRSLSQRREPALSPMAEEHSVAGSTPSDGSFGESPAAKDEAKGAARAASKPPTTSGSHRGKLGRVDRDSERERRRRRRERERRRGGTPNNNNNNATGSLRASRGSRGTTPRDTANRDRAPVGANPSVARLAGTTPGWDHGSPRRHRDGAASSGAAPVRVAFNTDDAGDADSEPGVAAEKGIRASKGTSARARLQRMSTSVSDRTADTFASDVNVTLSLMKLRFVNASLDRTFTVYEWQQFQLFGVLPCHLLNAAFVMVGVMYMLDDHVDAGVFVLASLLILPALVLSLIAAAGSTRQHGKLADFGRSDRWGYLPFACLSMMVR